MAWDGEERRRRITKDTGHRRRREDRDTDSWPHVERRTDTAEDTGRRRRETDVDMPPSVRELERALSRHEIEAREWRARHDARLENAEEQGEGNRDLLDGLIASVATALAKLEGLEKICLKIDGQTKPTSRLERTLTILVPVILAALPVIGAYLALKGQLAQVTQGPGK